MFSFIRNVLVLRIFSHNLFKNMSQDNLIKMRCQDCKQINYYSSKNKKLIKDKLVMKKYCSSCKKHTEHKEA